MRARRIADPRSQCLLALLGLVAQVAGPIASRRTRPDQQALAVAPELAAVRAGLVVSHAWPSPAARRRFPAASRPIFDRASGVGARARALPPREPSCCAALFFFRGASMPSSLASLALGPFSEDFMPSACYYLPPGIDLIAGGTA